MSKIAPGLLKLIFEETGDENSEPVITEIKNYEDFSVKLKQAIIANSNIKIEFVFAEDPIKPEGSVKKIKSNRQILIIENFDFGMGKLFMALVKSGPSYEEIKAKPQLLEADDKDIKILEKDVLQASAYNPEGARKAAEKYLKTKFFPFDLRTKIWIGLQENKAHINSRLYKAYGEVIDKKLKDNENYGKLL